MAKFTRVTVVTLLACLAGASSLGRTWAGPVQSDSAPAAGKPATDRSAAANHVNAQTALLELFFGSWSVTEKHFNKQGEVVATAKGSEEVRWLVDRRVLERTYITSTGSAVFRAIGLLSWNDVLKCYQGVWFDNLSTSGPNSVKGQWQQDTRTMVFSVESSGEDGATVRHKVVERFIDEEKRVATTYRIAGTQVVKLLEVHYKRTIPCPAGVRIIYDGINPRAGD